MRRSRLILSLLVSTACAAFAGSPRTGIADRFGGRVVDVDQLVPVSEPSDAEPRGGGSCGANWQLLNLFGGDIECVARSPVLPNVVLAGLAPNGVSGGCLFRSTD